ncbi:MAG TPA: TlpA disulfide reductase family protein [Candidatus Acidoferrales bacterium]|nr:TlpA disulfide reductase family protein [Candidatus Acidoferrales bacterium]
MKRKIITGLTLGAVAGLLIIFAIPGYNQGEASPAGSTAKDFSFTLDGKPAQLSDYRGKVVVLNFWATWCPPCVDETPSLVALQRYLSPKGGTVLGISADVDDQAYTRFIEQNGIDFPTYRDPSAETTTNGTHAKISSEYGTYMYPETYIIDRHGRIARKIVGAQDWMSPAMTEYLDSVLAER